MTEPAALELRTVGAVVRSLVVHPIDRLLLRWNWKAAALSATMRGLLFFAINLQVGVAAAWAAFLTEFVVRAVMSGFYGTITQAFRCAEPRWLATAAAMVILPVVSHSVEFAAHWVRGTEALAWSIAASVVLTLVSTAFHLHAMRQGVLTVGDGSQSFGSDLRSLPRLVLGFLRIQRRPPLGNAPADLHP